jgi:hypothetical protein
VIIIANPNEMEEMLIEDFDVWDADLTMATLNWAVMSKFRESLSPELGYPIVAPEDKGENLTDYFSWVEVVDQIVEAFAYLKDWDRVPSTLPEHVTHGLNLYVKYFTYFWT